jgi:hypothetical protein
MVRGISSSTVNLPLDSLSWNFNVHTNNHKIRCCSCLESNPVQMLFLSTVSLNATFRRPSRFPNFDMIFTCLFISESEGNLHGNERHVYIAWGRMKYVLGLLVKWNKESVHEVAGSGGERQQTCAWLSMGVLIFNFHCITPPPLNISEALKAKGLTW